jgi:hypothetical protein
MKMIGMGDPSGHQTLLHLEPAHALQMDIENEAATPVGGHRLEELAARGEGLDGKPADEISRRRARRTDRSSSMTQTTASPGPALAHISMRRVALTV